jgi:hypothetical protein
MKPHSRALALQSRHLGQLDPQERFQLLAPHAGSLQSGPAPSRQRLFPHWRTFWLFLFQTLCPGQSCRETVQTAKAWLEREKISSNTSGYCQARARLPEPILEGSLSDSSRRLCAQVPPSAFWLDRRVRVVDGSSSRMADTPENQKAYPQPKTQKPGCGFPVMRLLTLFCLSCGALIRYAQGPLDVAEKELWHRIWDALEPGDVLLGDRGFCSLGEFWWLRKRGVDCVTRLNARRSSGMKTVHRRSKNDRLVLWKKMRQPPTWMSAEQWAQVPELLLVRQITFNVEVKGFRTQQVTLATTLISAKLWPASQLIELYHRRWRVELFLRDIKTTLGMEMFSCKSPEMVRKELLMHLIAYNLIRSLMWEASARRGVGVDWLSFKGSLDTLRQWTPLLMGCGPKERKRMLDRFFAALGDHVLPDRPGRVEPRAIKTRPKNYPLLNKPRRQFVDIPHRNRYHKQEEVLS